MAARRYTTEFVITGDSSSGVQASQELQRAQSDLTQEMQRAERQSQQVSQSFESVSTHAQRLATFSAATAAAVGTMTISQTRNIAEQAAFAEAVGVSVQTLQRWEFAAKAAGMQSGEIGDIFKDTAEKIGDFVNNGGGEAADLFEVLNLNIKDLMDLSPDQQLLAVARAFDEVGNKGAKIAFIETLGNDATLLLPLLEDNAAALQEQILIADQLGVAIPQSDIDSLIAANQSLNELTALSSGFANAVAVNLAPSIVSLSNTAQEVVNELGGMGEIVHNVTDGAVLLSGVLAGRLVGSLGAAAAASVRKVQADRALAMQAGITAERETGAALATARRAEAERVAAVNSATIAAQRAQRATAEAAAQLRSIQLTQQQMTAERVLETQRLQAQISATGRQQSLTRLAEIRRAEMALTTQSTAAQKALTAAEAQGAASTRTLSAAKVDLTRATAATNSAVAANTAAVAANTGGQRAMTAASRGAAAAMALVGGPLGVATLAATAFFLFRDSSDEVSASLVDLDQPLEKTVENFREMNKEAQQAAVIRWGDRAEEEAEKASAALGSIRLEIANLSGARIFGGRDEEQYQGYRRLLTEINAVGDGAKNLTEVLDEAQQYMEIPEDMLRDLRLLAAEYSEHDEKSQQATQTLATLVDTLEDVANSADNAGDSVNTGAPSDATLDAWSKYNDRVRESIAAARDGGSAVGAANRAMDAMGDDVNVFMRGYTVFLASQNEALKDQKKAQEAAARAAERAASEAERNAQRQAKAAEQSAKEQAAALVGIQQEMDPLLKDYATYLERLETLDRALAEGAISEEAYGEAMRWNAEQYQRAATGAEEYETQTKSLVDKYDSHNQKARQLRDALEQINQRYRAGEIDGDQYARMVGGIRDEMRELALEAEPISKELARSWEEAANRINETFGDAFTGAYDSFEDFGDRLMDGVKRLIGEIAYQATLEPIVIGFTTDMRGALGIPGAGGESGGGFDFSNTLSAGRNLWKAGSSLFGGGAASGSLAMQGGLSSAALASASQVASGAAYSGALGSAASGAALGNAATASSGFMGAASAAMPWVAGGMLVDEVLGLGIVDGIVSGISGLFGSSPTPFSGRFGTRKSTTSGTFEHQDSTSERFYAESAFGSVGFIDDGTERLQRAGTGSKEWAEELAVATAQIDNMTAPLARTTAELEGMINIVLGLETSSRSAADIVDFALNQRPRAALEALEGDFGVFVRSLEGGIEEVVQQAQVGQQAHALLSDSMARLNLQFDATGAGAYEAASYIAQQAGGVENLAALQNQFFEGYFSQAERAAFLQEDLTESLAAMGLELPENEAGFRALVEAQNQNTEAGGRNYVQLLQLSSGFSQLQGMLGDTSAAADGAADSLKNAADAQRERESIENDWLRMIGDTAELRRRELAQLDPSNRALQQRNWLFEDEQKWLSEIEQRQQKRISGIKQEADAMARARSELASYGNTIGNWLAQHDATEQGMGTPRERLDASDNDFWTQYEKALQGDRNARQSITQFADRAIENLQEFYASSDPGVNGVNEIRDAMERLPELLTPEQFLADELSGALEDQTRTLTDVLDLNGDGTVSAIERAISAEWGATQQLNNVLHHEMTQLGATVLTEAEVRAALGPHATDAEISRLIARVDTNGDGMITRQELTNSRIGSLSSGIATSIAPLFDQIDIDGSGWIDYNEFSKTFEGMATDSTLHRIFSTLDTDGDGVISRLEAINGGINHLNVGIAASIAPLFDQIDIDASGWIDYSEFSKTFEGMATDSTLHRIFSTLDTDGDGVISRLEAINAGINNLYSWVKNQPSGAQPEIAGVMALYESLFGREADLEGLKYWVDVAENQNKTLNEIERWMKQSDEYKNRPATGGAGGDSTGGSTGGGSAAQPGRTPRPFWERVASASMSATNREWMQHFQEGNRVLEAQRLIRDAGISVPAYATGAWDLPSDHLALLHKNEFIAPAAGGIADEFRAYAAGDYQAELLAKMDSLQLPSGPMQLPMPEMPPLPQFPALGSSDVLQVLNDVRKELQETRKENKRLLELISDNTGDTVEAIEQAAARSEQLGAEQLDELETISRASRTEKHTT